MRFEWDENKNRANIRKHGIDFTDAVDIFSHPLLMFLDTREAYGEERWTALGWIKTVMGVVVYVERTGDVIRIISARKATKSEERRYEQSIEN
jgi:uncharacterized protein